MIQFRRTVPVLFAVCIVLLKKTSVNNFIIPRPKSYFSTRFWSV